MEIVPPDERYMMSSDFRVIYQLVDSEDDEERVSYGLGVGPWCIGDMTVSCRVAEAMSAIDLMLQHEGNRRDAKRFGYSAERLHAEIQTGISVDFDPAFEVTRDWQRHFRHLVLAATAANFTGWTAFLVDGDQHSRLIWRAPGERRVFEAQLAPGAFEAGLREFRAGLEARANARRSVPPRSGERYKGSLRDAG